MVRTKFKHWAERKIESLNKVFISTEFVKHKMDESFVPNPSIGLIHESNVCLGQVTVWASCQMEFEVVNIETEEMILWKYIEKVSEDAEFDSILKEYFDVLQSGFNTQPKIRNV
ncbi:hypothetical protein J14TS5_10690 [Paenibacillus lautus]|uniref:immunity protein TriTu family protein n=1 Tax=Paenibacillus lautus TaxID=1401 RepID=UPI001B010ECD|nr:hypothetical protein [Paenibacillus lautus]GIO95983.1 hypothetical protein J14TS5_10690 [Paenibacillus lautus]